MATTVTVSPDQAEKPQATSAPQPPNFEQLAQQSTQAFDRDMERAAAERRQTLKERDELLGKFVNVSPALRFMMSDADREQRLSIAKQWAQQKTQEAQQPLENAVKAHLDRGEALKQAEGQGKLSMQNFATQEEWNPNTPEAGVLREVLSRATGVKIPETASVGHLKAIAERLPGVSEAMSKFAAAAKTSAEAQQVAPSAAAERGLKAAEARKASAEAGVEERKLIGEPAPGYDRAGPYNEKNDSELQNKDAENKVVNSQLGGIIETLGDRNIVTTLRDPTAAAQIQSKLKEHAFGLKKAMGVKLTPSTEKMIDEMVGDPTKLTVGNALGQARIRLQTALDSENESHREWVKSHQFSINPSHPIHGGNAPQTNRTTQTKTIGKRRFEKRGAKWVEVS